MKIAIDKSFSDLFSSSISGRVFAVLPSGDHICHPAGAVCDHDLEGERQPNVCFHSWSCFHGDRTAFYAVMGNLYQHTHTYANIRREHCFGLNFLPISSYDALVKTIHHNEETADEFAVADLRRSWRRPFTHR